MIWLTAVKYVTNDHGYVPLVVNTSRPFPHSWLFTGFVTRLTRRVSLVEQELPTFPEHLRSPTIFSGVRVTRSLVLCVCFVDRCLSFCPFSFGHCIVCPTSIYGKTTFRSIKSDPLMFYNISNWIGQYSLKLLPFMMFVLPQPKYIKIDK
jgi:hypothetical protein